MAKEHSRPRREDEAANRTSRDEADPLAEGACSIAEAVAFSGVGRTSLYEHIRSGRLPTVLLGRKRLIPRAALKAFLRQHLEVT